MNFLTCETAVNGDRLPNGPHFAHCYIYKGHHCSCGGNYQGDNPGSVLCECGTTTDLLHDCDATEK